MRDLEVSAELPGFGGDGDRSRHLRRVLGAAKSPAACSHGFISEEYQVVHRITQV